MTTLGVTSLKRSPLLPEIPTVADTVPGYDTASWFGIGVRAVKKRFTKRGEDPGEIILRHKKDEHFGTVCQFLDSETRRCTIYEGRPTACREFPGAVRCGYYDFLSFERGTQKDKDFISTTWNHH